MCVRVAVLTLGVAALQKQLDAKNKDIREEAKKLIRMRDENANKEKEKLHQTTQALESERVEFILESTDLKYQLTKLEEELDMYVFITLFFFSHLQRTKKNHLESNNKHKEEEHKLEESVDSLNTQLAKYKQLSQDLKARLESVEGENVHLKTQVLITQRTH